MKKYLILLCLLSNSSYAENVVGKVKIDDHANLYTVTDNGRTYKLAFTHIQQPSDLRRCGQDTVVISGTVGECGSDFILLVGAVRRRDDVVSDAKAGGNGEDQLP